MSTNQTQYYHLSQWEPDDKVLREDFNHDNQIIDQVMWRFGNCQVIIDTFSGTGEASRSWTFLRAPMLFILQGGGSSLMAIRGEETVLSRHRQGGGLCNIKGEKISNITYNITWTSQSGSALDACNEKDVEYHLLYLYSMSER